MSGRDAGGVIVADGFGADALDGPGHAGALRFRAFVGPLLDAVAVRPGSRLLDVACGPGYVSEAAAARGARPVGLDVAEAMIERARRRCPDLSFVVGDALRLPFPDASFDAVTMNFGILHVSQPQLALAEARRALVAGGRFAFTTWVAEGNAQEEITAAALGEHGVAVEVAEGPSYYVFSDLDECCAALATARFDRQSVRRGDHDRQWRIPSPDRLFEAQLHAGVRTAVVCERSRVIGWKRSGQRWPPACAATPTATTSRCRSSRA